MAGIEYDSDPLDGIQISEIVGIVENSIPVKEEDVDYIDNNDEGMVYRVVDLNEHRKMNAMASGDASLPANCQYVLINSANGYIQALATPTTTDGIEDSDLHVDRPRSSVTIKPKSVHIDVDVEARLAAATANAQAAIDTPPTNFKKRDDRRRATHNEVERRRRDKINHWIMKLGSIIPADGTSLEVGDDEPVSVAAVEGQSKGNILSRACEYVQTLQERLSSVNEEELMANGVGVSKFEVEVLRLRRENAHLREILRKNGITCELNGGAS